MTRFQLILPVQSQNVKEKSDGSQDVLLLLLLFTLVHGRNPSL